MKNLGIFKVTTFHPEGEDVITAVLEKRLGKLQSNDDSSYGLCDHVCAEFQESGAASVEVQVTNITISTVMALKTSLAFNN